jgi:hypothetical protein
MMTNNTDESASWTAEACKIDKCTHKRTYTYIRMHMCYDMEVGENRVRVFYGTEKREGERLEIYTGGISPCSRDRVSDL